MTINTVLSFGPHVPTRFSGRTLEELLLLPAPAGVFDDDVWRVHTHPDAGSASATGTVVFGSDDASIRIALKELFVLALVPAVHGADHDTVFGLPSKSMGTVMRWFNTLPADLAWLASRAGGLDRVVQTDLDAWLTSGIDIDHRRVRALLAFAEYGAAFTEGLPRLRIRPWAGRSALSVSGDEVSKGANTTRCLDFAELGPLLLTAMTILENSNELLALVNSDERTVSVPIRSLDGDRSAELQLGRAYASAAMQARALVSSCAMFITAAFTGMRSTEVEAIPRDGPLDQIAALGVARSLVVSYLVKGQNEPIRQKWLIPPVVTDAVETMQQLLDEAGIPRDVVFSPTGHPPLFDRRALSMMDKPGVKSTMRFERAVTAVAAAADALADLGFVSAPPLRKVSGRELRRTFAMIVSSRPGGAQAAMAQFKWQDTRTALGYFHVAPTDLATAQRELYDEIRELERDLVLDTAIREYDRWKRAVDRCDTPPTPAGPGSDRLIAAFRAVHDEMGSAGVVIEDTRRLRQLMGHHSKGLEMTAYGFCNFDPEHALCGGTITANPTMCRPNECLNSTTTTEGLAAHRVKRRRLMTIADDKQLPGLARERILAEIELIDRDLGPLAEEDP